MEAMMNGDLSNPDVPLLSYQMCLSHGQDKEKVKTEVIGIMCPITKARLLKDFYSQLASLASYEKQVGIFIPTGAVHLLGATNFANLI